MADPWLLGIKAAAIPAAAAALAADSDALVAAQSGLRLMGYAIRESAGTPAVAAVDIMHGATGAGGTLVVPIELAANASGAVWFGPDGISVEGGVSIRRVAGTVDIVVFTKVVKA